ncbi:MAG: hypothetical protein JWP01_3454 [Myxococcales bacterium]|nr:hypothetical protein [Myxococcales bacterium]
MNARYWPCFSVKRAVAEALDMAIAQWERRRNREGAGIDWMFTVDRSREKLGRAYPARAGHPLHRALRAAA